MSQNIRSIIVADTGPLIALAKINQLSLLTQLYQHIQIPDAVLSEATINTHWQDAQQIAHFANEYAQICPDLSGSQITKLLHQLDMGESQAIALADRLKCPVLLDERRGRTVAKQLQIDVIGTIGLLLTAKRENLIPEITCLLQEMTKRGYRLAPALVKQALELAGESR